MIIKSENKDIFKTDAKHIAFAINKEGFNDYRFVRLISEMGWKELTNCGEHELGTVLTKTIGDKTYHALVCHSFREGWGDNQRELIKMCFDNIPTDEPITSVAIGAGSMAEISGADLSEIICGMHDSSKKIQLISMYSLENIIDMYNNKTNIFRVNDTIEEDQLVEYSAKEHNIRTLDEAIRVLREFQFEGIYNVYIDFNGHKLYSRDINTNDAYMLVTGMKKKDWLLYVQNEARKSRKRIKEAKQHAIDNLESIIEEGKKYIYPEKYELWEKCCIADSKGAYHLYNVECALEVMKLVENGVSVEEINEVINNQGHSGYSLFLTMTFITKVCKKGPEIYRYRYSDSKNEEINQLLLTIENNNKIYEANEKAAQGPVKKLTPKVK